MAGKEKNRGAGAEKKRKSLRLRLSDALELPPDVVLNLPRITLVGSIQLAVENHRGIVLYTPEQIKLSLPEGVLAVEGKNLSIRNLYSVDLIVDGEIQTLRFETETVPNGG